MRGVKIGGKQVDTIVLRLEKPVIISCRAEDKIGWNTHLWGEGTLHEPSTSS